MFRVRITSSDRMCWKINGSINGGEIDDHERCFLSQDIHPMNTSAPHKPPWIFYASGRPSRQLRFNELPAVRPSVAYEEH